MANCETLTLNSLGIVVLEQSVYEQNVYYFRISPHDRNAYFVLTRCHYLYHSNFFSNVFPEFNVCLCCSAIWIIHLSSLKTMLWIVVHIGEFRFQYSTIDNDWYIRGMLLCSYVTDCMLGICPWQNCKRRNPDNPEVSLKLPACVNRGLS